MPERLRPVHAHIVTATDQQIALYHDFAHAKSRDASVDLRTMPGHPALRAANQELLTAYGMVKQLYPDLDRQTEAAIHQHLCS